MLSNDKVYVFLSPHLDDAVLSCGSLMTELIKKKKQVRVITLFTKAGNGPETQFARDFVYESGFNDAFKLFEERKMEDSRALLSLGIMNYVHLPYIDAAWRKYPDSKHVFSGKIHPDDRTLITEITQKLMPLIPKNSTILAPLGIGSHVDHIITNLIADRLPATKHLFWADHPYIKYVKKIKLNNFKINLQIQCSLEKTNALSHYKTQIIPIYKYYSPNSQLELFFAPIN